MATNLIATMACVGAVLSARTAVQGTPPDPQSPEGLVQTLGQLHAEIPGLDI